ncbi:MAG: cyclohexanone monooxygenase [Pseudonocardiales bacterium]|nr:cyclohexanone monooxygenase [Pseudonocardiales bacterium]
MSTLSRPVEPSSSPTYDRNFDELRSKYQEERAKRIRAVGPDQYRVLQDGSTYLADPFEIETAPRDAVTKTTDVAIIGGGFAGLLAAIEMLGRDVADITIIEKASEFGGVWYWNRYPGVRCDTEAYMYLPRLEETGYVPPERYARGDTILQYLGGLAERYNLYEKALLSTRVTHAEWVGDSERWEIRTDHGDIISARYLIVGTGGLLHRPKLPEIDGIDTFEGTAFHSSRWNYAYTGGDVSGDMRNLRDKKVALVGTGASAIQAAPHLAEDAAHLYVVQRTPSAIDIRANQPTNSDWFARLEPGWQERRAINFELLLAGVPQDHDEVGDQWTQIWKMPDLSAATSREELSEIVEAFDFGQMERIRRRIDEIVKDPSVAEALKPYYNSRCKRPCFNDEYLPTFNRRNVTLLDTKGRGLDAMTPRGIVVNGTEYAVDCVVFATGFEAAVSPGTTGGFDILGRTGERLAERWSRDAVSVHGMCVDGFPNFFALGNVRQGSVTINAPYTTATQAAHVAELVSSLKNRDVDVLEVSADEVMEWQETLRSQSRFDEKAVRSCTPGYYTNEGDLDSVVPLFASAYGAGIASYRQALADWRKTTLDRVT